MKKWILLTISLLTLGGDGVGLCLTEWTHANAFG